MTRGQIAAVLPDGNLITSIEFNGDMDLTERGKEVVEELKYIESEDEFKEFVERFNKEHFSYYEHPRIYDCEADYFNMQTDYFGKWFSDYVYVKNLSEKPVVFTDTQGHKLEIPFLLASYYGFRRSEVLGLRWSAVDFDHKLISINHKLIVVGKEVIFTDELKTKTSNRTLPLIPAIEEALLKHRAQIEENKEFYGNSYDQRYLDYVCVEENGKIIYPDHMTKKFADLLKEHGLKHIRLHDLRHSCASNMLASGVPMKEIQEWLGHSNFSTTADVYSHLDFSAKIRAAKTISSVYDSGEKPVQTAVPTPIEQEPMKVFADAIKEMQALGIERLEDYLVYKETGKFAKRPAQM